MSLGWACEALANLSLQIRPTGLGMGLGRPNTLIDLLQGLLCDLEEIIQDEFNSPNLPYVLCFVFLYGGPQTFNVSSQC